MTSSESIIEKYRKIIDERHETQMEVLAKELEDIKREREALFNVDALERLETLSLEQLKTFKDKIIKLYPNDTILPELNQMIAKKESSI